MACMLTWCIPCALIMGCLTAASPETLGDVFEENRKIWKQHNCTFPDPSTYDIVNELSIHLTKPLEEDDVRLALEPCTDQTIKVSFPGTAIHNVTTEICMATFHISRMLCTGPVIANADLQEKLRKENLAPRMTSLRSGSACNVLRNELNVTSLSFLGSSQQECQKYCEQTPSLAPLCRLLTAVLQTAKAVEYTEDDKRQGTTAEEHITDTQSHGYLSTLQTEPPLTATENNTKAKMATTNKTFNAMPQTTSSHPMTTSETLHPLTEATSSHPLTEYKNYTEENSEDNGTQLSVTTHQTPSAVTGETGSPAGGMAENTTQSQKNMTVTENLANQTLNSTTISGTNTIQTNSSSKEEPTAVSLGSSNINNSQHSSGMEKQSKDDSMIQVMAWLTGALLLTIGGFVLHKNREKIKNCAMKIASGPGRTQNGSKVKYHKLKAIVDDLMPTQGKPTFSKSHDY